MTAVDDTSLTGTTGSDGNDDPSMTSSQSSGSDIATTANQLQTDTTEPIELTTTCQTSHDPQFMLPDDFVLNTGNTLSGAMIAFISGMAAGILFAYLAWRVLRGGMAEMEAIHSPLSVNYSTQPASNGRSNPLEGRF